MAGAAVFALTLPLSGLVAYRYLVGAGSFAQPAPRFGVLALTRERARFLVAERAAIIAELERGKLDYLATKGRSP